MLVIKPIQDKEQQRQLVAECGAAYDESAFAYAATECSDDGETVLYVIGACQFAMHDGRGEISLLRCRPGIEDDEAMMIMARAAASFLFRCGIRYLIMDAKAADLKLITALGFTSNAGGEYELDIFRYYSTPCHER